MFAEPVDGLVSLQQRHSEDAAVLTVWAREGLVREIEQVSSETQDGVETAVLPENATQFSLPMWLGDAVDEVLKEVIDRELPFGKVHALGCELGDGISDII